jgi:flagellar hook-associated protein 2
MAQIWQRGISVGSPITFSGFNQIDFSLILNAVMQQESQPLRRLETQKTALETQKTAFGTLAAKLGALETASDALKQTDSLGVLKAVSSGTGVEVSAASGSNTGTYNVVVSELARSQVLASTGTFASLDDVVATSGNLTITPATGDPVVIAVSASTTIQQLAKAINDNGDSPVSASVVQSAPGTYRLVLSGKNTGEANAFTVAHTLTGGAGLTFTDTDADNVYGDDAADNTQVARNASLTVNGLAIQSSSNIVNDVVPGVTLTLRNEDPAQTIVVDVTKDASATKSKVTAFIDAYNAVINFFNEQNTASIAGKASIGRDPILRGFKNGMRQALQASYADATTYTRLAAVGLGFDRTGKMTLDEKVFDAVIDDDPGDLQALFAGADGDGGAFGAISSLIESYTESGGLIADVRDRITEQVKAMNSRLDQMEQRLAIRRLTLQREFTAADNLMTQLNSQGNSLSALANQYRLF